MESINGGLKALNVAKTVTKKADEPVNTAEVKGKTTVEEPSGGISNLKDSLKRKTVWKYNPVTHEWDKVGKIKGECNLWLNSDGSTFDGRKSGPY